MDMWSALQLRFHHTECKTLHQQTTGLTSVLPQATMPKHLH